MAVLNTTSPAAEVKALKDSPSMEVPSSRVSFTIWVIVLAMRPTPSGPAPKEKGGEPWLRGYEKLELKTKTKDQEIGPLSFSEGG